MPEVEIKGGLRVEIPSRAEHRQDIAAELDARERFQARAFKWMRLPIYTGTPSGSAVTIDPKANGGVILGPESGYAWSIMRIIIDGMTSGTTPDVINMYRNSVTGQPPLWEFNGNNFGYTFSRWQMVLQGGDSLQFASSGTFAATGLIRVSGELIELPAEMLYKLGGS
jgi:hypothetical protein